MDRGSAQDNDKSTPVGDDEDEDEDEDKRTRLKDVSGHN